MQYVSGRRINQDFGVPGITTNDTVVNVDGRIAVGIGTTARGVATADIDTNTLRIRDTVIDSEGFGGELGYFLTKDNKGLTWVEVSPITSNSIFVADNGDILGVSSFTGLNIISDQLIGVTTNGINSSFADIRIDPRWYRDRTPGGGGGIYTTGTVGIGLTQPRLGNVGVLTDVKLDVLGDAIFSGIISATSFIGEFNVDTKDLNVSGIASFTGNTDNVIGDTNTGTVQIDGGVGIDKNVSIGASLDVNNLLTVGSAVTIGNGIVSATTGDFTNLELDNLNVSGFSTFGNTARFNGAVNIFDDLFVSGNISVGGEGVTLDTETIRIEGKELLIGFTTTITPNDTTANSAGISIASTEGYSLADLEVPGVNVTFNATITDRAATIATGAATTIGITTNSISLGQVVRGNFVSTGTTVTSIGSEVIGLSTETSNTVDGITALDFGTITSTPNTYKQFKWFKNGTFVGQGTDAFISNQPISIGGTQIGNGQLFAVGDNINFTEDEIKTKNLKVTGNAVIDKNTQTKSLKVTGVSTFVGLSTFTKVGIGTTNVISNDKLTIIGDTRLGGVNDTLRVGTAITMSNGIVTATTFDGNFLSIGNLSVSGIATINTGIVTNLSVSGIATINTGIITDLSVSGIATINTGIITDLSVSGIATIGNIVFKKENDIGIITSVGIGTTVVYYGDGSNLEGIISGVGIQSSGTVIGTGFTTLNFIGTGNTFVGVGNTINISINSSQFAGFAQTAGIATNLANGAGGEIVYQSAADTTAFLRNGTPGQVLVSNGGTNAPQWADGASTGAIDGITIIDEVTTVGGSGSISTLNFKGSAITATASGNISTITVTIPSIPDVNGSAGIASTARDVIGGIGSLTSLSVSGISTLGTVEINAGVITATSGIVTYYGDGQYLENIITESEISNQSVAFAQTAGLSTETTKLQTSRTFEITGDVVASPISFNGTGNVSLAATIQSNSVGLGTDTFGDYVKSITGTSNEVTVSVTSGEGSTPQIGLPDDVTIGQDLTVIRDVQINRNLNVNGNITIGGTSATLFTQTLTVADPDLILGVRTDALGNDISTDNTANHGGIAIASTEGNPLITLTNPGAGETLPSTYKKIMWFKSGSFSGLGTDAWLSNYAIGIGSTQFPTGTRLAAGSVQFTENDLAAVRNINASGISTLGTVKISAGIVTSTTGTAVSFFGNLTGTASTASFATTAFNLNSPETFSVGFAQTAGIATYTSEWNITANGTSDYRFTGPGFTGSENDPTIYLTRGEQYKFTNNLGAHPFQIQRQFQNTGGTAYNDGIANNGVSNGTLTWNVRMDAPDILYYQCTSHTNMSGKIYIVNAGIASDVNLFTTGIATIGSVQINAGIVTATSGIVTYYGDGQYLQNITSSGGISSITISNNTLDQSQYLTYAVSTGNTTGLGVTTEGLVFNPFTGRMGIGQTLPQAKLDINVGTGLTALNIEGSEGQLFSITNNLTSGSIFSVNDVSGIPSIDVDADGTIQLAPFGSTEYVGIGTTNPTQKLDVNGNIRLRGALYDNSNGIGATNQVLTSTGSGISWQDAAVSGVGIQSGGTVIGTGITTLNFVGAGNTFALNGNTVDISIVTSDTTRTVNTYTATSAQTTFSATYNVGYVDVFLNGVKLSENEYTATNGTSIVLDTGASLNDIVEVVGYSNINISGSTPDISPIMMGMIF